LTAIIQDLTPLSAAQSEGGGIYADVLVGSLRFDIDLTPDGHGNQILSNLDGAAPTSYTITGLGANYVNIQMDYNHTSQTVSYYVNGILVLSDVQGANAAQPSVIFDGIEGNFNLVSLQLGSGDAPTTPVFPTAPCSRVDCFTFHGARTGLWFDPPTASGYTYQMTDGSLFTEIADLPTGFLNPFDVTTPGCSIPGTFSGGQSVDFVALCGKGVSEFTISGINPMFDPTDPGAFPIQLDFNTPTADFIAEPLGSAVAEPSTWAMLLLGFGGLGFIVRFQKKPALRWRSKSAAR
jgi:hypothetical protein